MAKNITIKSESLIMPMFMFALNHVSTKEFSVPLMKQWRRIKKSILKEVAEIKEDTQVLIKDIFGDRFSQKEILTYFGSEEKDRPKVLAGFEFSPDKLEDFNKSLEVFEKKTKELGDIVVEIPFPKFVLPDSVTVREDCASFLEDVIELD